MKYIAIVDGKEFSVDVAEREGDAHFSVTIDSQTYQADFEPAARDWLYSLILDGKAYEVASDGDQIEISGERYVVEVVRDLGLGARGAMGASAEGPAKLKAPIPGLVVAVEVSVGDEVQEQQTLVILEAMKMQMELKSPRSGRVSEVAVSHRQEVNQGQTLVVVV